LIEPRRGKEERKILIRTRLMPKDGGDEPQVGRRVSGSKEAIEKDTLLYCAASTREARRQGEKAAPHVQHMP
jgi:hypothetical protein